MRVNKAPEIEIHDERQWKRYKSLLRYGGFYIFLMIWCILSGPSTFLW